MPPPPPSEPTWVVEKFELPPSALRESPENDLLNLNPPF